MVNCGADKQLLQLRVLGFAFLRMGMLGSASFQRGEEILVGGKCPDAGGIGRPVSVVLVAVCARFPPKSTRRNPSVPRSIPSHAYRSNKLRGYSRGATHMQQPGGWSDLALRFKSRINSFGVTAGMEQMCKSLTDRGVSGYKEFSTSLCNSQTLAAKLFRKNK